MNAITAKLIFDSWFDVFPGVRSNGSLERHLIYEGGGVLLDLVLRRTDEDGYLDVGGQMLPADAGTETVFDGLVMLENGDGCLKTRTNALGEFAFHQIHLDGCFTISILTGERRLVVEGDSCADTRTWQVTPTCVGDVQ
jgi:hypothetical protein